jgi:restriction system protein
MLPNQKEIELPVLEILVELGGEGKPKQIYPLVTKKFSQLTRHDLAETLASGQNKWTNRIQWVRQALINKGELDSPSRGVWRITEKGRQRLSGSVVSTQEITSPTFEELYREYESAFRARVLAELQDLSPRQFELFARKLLMRYGFAEVKVTQVGKDGGIDGNGKLRLGLAMMNVAFQCKKWQGNIGRPEVDKFRGAIQGEFEQGVFFTTSDFTAAARKASLKQGAVPIILLNGDSIVDLMIERGLGVQREPLYAYYEQFDELAGPVEEED